MTLKIQGSYIPVFTVYEFYERSCGLLFMKRNQVFIPFKSLVELLRRLMSGIGQCGLSCRFFGEISSNFRL